MNNVLLSAGVLALFGAVTLPAASAQMCGPGQQAQVSSTTTTTSGMMCGSTSQTPEDPMADPADKKPAAASGMCSCCQNMAMMKGMMGGQKSGMDMPKQ